MITQAWFRLDEFLPMAERTLHDAIHPTGTEIHRTNPHSPDPSPAAAISWARPTHRTLRTPQNDAATAWTWRHRTTGRYGTATRPGHAAVYLPPTTEQRATSLYSRLPAAELAGCHWMAVSTHRQEPG